MAILWSNPAQAEPGHAFIKLDLEHATESYFHFAPSW